MRYHDTHVLRPDPGPYPPGESHHNYMGCDDCDGPLDEECAGAYIDEEVQA